MKGTDGGLTTDHKPDVPSEKERICQCGGHVQEAMGGIARVNGELAVSRSFGDANHKRMGGNSKDTRDSHLRCVMLRSRPVFEALSQSMSEVVPANRIQIRVSSEHFGKELPNGGCEPPCWASTRRTFKLKMVHNPLQFSFH